jgi:hypothetical protein
MHILSIECTHYLSDIDPTDSINQGRSSASPIVAAHLTSITDPAMSKERSFSLPIRTIACFSRSSLSAA